MQKIGVFVCWCGSNIAATVDVQAVSDALAKEPGVVFSTNYQIGRASCRERVCQYV